VSAGPYLPQQEDGTPSVVAMMACGSAAGLTAQTLTFPTDTVRHRMQANGIGGMVRAPRRVSLATATASLTYRVDAPRGSYRWARGVVVRRVGLCVVFVWPFPDFLLGGHGVGWPQANVYSSTADCFRKIYVKEGLKGFFRGWGLNVVRSLPGAAVQFTSYDLLKSLLGLQPVIQR
jgi:hypothetical protein